MRDVIRSLSFSPNLSTWTDLPNPLTCFFHPVTSLHLSEPPRATFLSGLTDVLRLPIDHAGVPSALLNKWTDIHHALIDTVNQLYNWMDSAWFCLHSTSSLPCFQAPCRGGGGEKGRRTAFGIRFPHPCSLFAVINTKQSKRCSCCSRGWCKVCRNMGFWRCNRVGSKHPVLSNSGASGLAWGDQTPPVGKSQRVPPLLSRWDTADNLQFSYHGWQKQVQTCSRDGSDSVR